MTQKAFEGLLGLKVLIRSIGSEDVLVRNEFECEMITFYYAYMLPPSGKKSRNESNRVFLFLS